MEVESVIGIAPVLKTGYCKKSYRIIACSFRQGRLVLMVASLTCNEGERVRFSYCPHGLLVKRLSRLVVNQGAGVQLSYGSPGSLVQWLNNGLLIHFRLVRSQCDSQVGMMSTAAYLFSKQGE